MIDELNKCNLAENDITIYLRMLSGHFLICVTSNFEGLKVPKEESIQSSRS